MRDAFKGGIADKVLIPRGTRLYKFNDFTSLYNAAGLLKEHGITTYENVAISPWWSPYERFYHSWSKESGLSGGTDDPGWEVKKKMAKLNGVSIREWGRITSAVKENWNSLRYLMVITLKVDAFGFFGGFAHMSRLESGQNTKRFGNEGASISTARAYKSAGMQERQAKYGTRGTLAGGGTQFYVPNIKVANVAHYTTKDLEHE